MTDASSLLPTVAVERPHRADARRNFDALLTAARDTFAECGCDASLEAIARRAGVGIGTLYRHFPTRQDLFEAVYVGEVEELVRAAGEVSDREPWDAFEAWLERFVAYIATKRAILDVLSRDAPMFKQCRPALFAAGEPLWRRVVEAGEGREDVDFDDVLRLVSGILAGVYADDAQRDRVLAIALSGVRA